MSHLPTAKNEKEWRQSYLKTRKSLIDRLENWEDQRTWDEFYKTYWRLIYSVALKAGLTSEEAFDAVQETVISIAKQFQDKKYDSNAGSFKSWLLNLARWRITDQFRKRAKEVALPGAGAEQANGSTDAYDRLPDPDANVLERTWDAEWNKNLAEVAIDKVKEKVSPRQYQIFDAYVVKEWPVRRVVNELGVSVAQVYLAKHRVGGLIRKEVEQLESKLL